MPTELDERQLLSDTPQPTRRPALLGLAGTNAADLVGCAIACVSVMSYLPDSLSPFWVPRMAAGLLWLPIGLLFLARLARRVDRSALVGVALAGWAAIGVALSASPLVSLLGSFGRFTSFLLFLSALCAWAIGRHTSDRGRELLGWVITVSFAFSAMIAVVQLAVEPTSPFLTLNFGRPGGLAGGPIHFGAHAAAVSAWFGYRLVARVNPWWLIGFAGAAFFAALSGSRIALLSTLAVACWVTVRARRRDAAMTIPVVFLMSVLASLVHGVFGTGQSAGDRFATTGGVAHRLDLWRFGLEGWAERPLVGWGIGRFRPATQGHFTDAWVREFPSDETGVWLDAHNYLVEQLVTTGIVGLALLVAFVVLAVRAAGGPLLWMAGVMSLVWLVEPAGPATHALGALALGGAMASQQPAVSAALTRKLLALALVPGLFLSSWFLVAEWDLKRQAESPTERDLNGFAVWFRGDPAAAKIMADSSLVMLGDRPEESSERSLTWVRRVAESEPDMTFGWSMVGIRSLRLGLVEEARLAAQTALDLQPNNVLALKVMAVVATRTDDETLAAEVERRLCPVDEFTCPG